VAGARGGSSVWPRPCTDRAESTVRLEWRLEGPFATRETPSHFLCRAWCAFSRPRISKRASKLVGHGVDGVAAAGESRPNLIATLSPATPKSPWAPSGAGCPQSPEPIAVGTALQLSPRAAPRTDPSERDYRTRLLPRVRTSKRFSGHGCVTRAGGIQRFARRLVLTQAVLSC
jgi:hypothetical protein